MSQELANSLDLNRAWRRVRFDHTDRVFASHPYLIDLVELDLADWLDRINQRIIDGYIPSSCLALNVPKSDWQVRPGGHLTLDDEILYSALTGSCYGDISQSLRWSQGDPDIAYQIPAGIEVDEWVRRGFIVWREWRVKSIERLNRGAEFVLFSDISAFYENIDLSRLGSDLRRMHLNEEASALLSSCLHRWAQPRGKGIPQGCTPSDLMAKLYLEPVDRTLRDEGFDHLRYVDDIRVFCRDFRQAKKALLRLTELLRNRGLNIQSAKTKIVRADLAIHEIDGITPIIQAILHDLQEEIREGYDLGTYGTVADLEHLADAHPDHPPVEVLERAFRDHFVGGTEDFDKTLFHFLLTRLGAVLSEYARDYCVGLLGQRPEETEYILKYLKRIGLTEPDQGRIIAYLNSHEAIYEYQVFQILRHFYEQSLHADEIVQFCRRIFNDGGYPPWVKHYAIALLGMRGSPADLEQIEARYSESTDSLQRATLIRASYQMERARRNVFLGRVRQDGWLEDRAARWVRERY